MRVLALTSLFFLGSLASPVAAENAAVEEVHELYARADNFQQVSSGIDTIKGDTVAINNTLNTVDPNAASIPIGTLTTLLSQSTKLVNDIKSTSAAANSSDKFNYPETFTLGAKIIALEPVINSTLQNFVNHKPAFTNQGLAGVVLTQLKTQRQATSDFGAGLGPKLAAPFNSFAPVITKMILGYFDTAIRAYSS